jgi:MFS family permease
MTRRSALDGLNFWLADSPSVLGPYLGIFLLTTYHWDQASIGLISMVGGLTGIAAKIPAGALIDSTRAKRTLLVATLSAMALAAAAVVWWPTLWVVVAVTVVVTVAGAIQGPIVSALTLGLFDRVNLARQMGRNSAFDHAGNAFTAVVAGVVGSLLSQRAVFMLVPLFSIAAGFCVLAIRPQDIDHERARGGGAATDAAPAELLRHGPLVVFAACVALFHLANAAMLPLVGQRLALAHAGYESAMMSACIIGAQLVMLPVALACGIWADRSGRKPLLMVAFAVLALRGALYTLSGSPAWLLAVQLLDGVGAGTLGVMVPLVVADLTRGSGRYNMSLGAIAAVGGVGAALSNAAAGAIVVRFGYDTAFLALASVAAMALLLLWLLLPETANGVRTAPAPGLAAGS